MHREQKTPCSGILFFINETSNTHILRGFKGPPRTIIFKKQWIHLACTETLETTTFKRQNAQELFMQIAIFQERGLSLHHASKRGLPTRDSVVRPLKILLQHAPKRISPQATPQLGNAHQPASHQEYMELRKQFAQTWRTCTTH